MVGTTTRARKKTKEPEVVEERVEEKADDERDTQIKLLSMTVQQHSVNMAVEAQKRDALEAELRQALTETRFELRQLQQSRAKSIDAIKEVKDRCERLNSQYVGHEASIVGMRRDVDRLLDNVLVSSRKNAPQSPQSSVYEEDDVKQKSQLSRDKCRMGTSRAESMVSELDDARSEVSSVTTGYCHSSLEAALAAVRGTRRE